MNEPAIMSHNAFTLIRNERSVTCPFTPTAHKSIK